MGMEDDRLAARDPWNRGERRHAEERITTRIVRVIGAWRTVEIRAVEVLGILDEVHFRADARVVGALRQSPQSRRLDATADLDAEGRTNGLDLRRRVAYGGVERHHDRRLQSGGVLESRQAGHCLTEATAARERRELGDDVY